MDSRSPNLLFVFADQMRGMDMRCAGNQDMVTPTMDRLAREGVMCTHHYATIPLCCPNRATLMTGTYGTTHRLLFNDLTVPTNLPSMGTIAQAHGYRTGYIGKWHMDGMPRDKFTPPGPRRLGFDDFWAVHNCNHDYFDPHYYRDTPDLVRVQGYEPEVQTDLTIQFLDGQQEDDRPFCLVVSWGPPHNPYEQVPEKYQQMYDPDKLLLRPNCQPIDRRILDPAWSHRPTTRDYYALISSLDDQLGRMLDKLDEMGAVDNTIVVFTSDHGDMMWSHGLLYKCVPFEESVHVPLLVRWPDGLSAKRTCSTLIGTVDLLPTLSGLLGWRCPTSVEGVDLSAALVGTPGASEPTSVLMAYFGRYVFSPDFPISDWRALRTQQYTYAETADRKPWMLFDNDADRYQMENLAGNSAHAVVEQRLARELDAWLTRLGDPFLPGPQMAQHFAIGRNQHT